MFLSLGIVLTGCPDTVNKTQKEIEKNNLDLPNPIYIDRLGVRFALPEMFEEDSYTQFTLKSADSHCFVAEEVSLYFSIERFYNSEIEGFRFAMEDADSLSDLEVLKKHILKSRELSLVSPLISEPVELFSRTGKNGWIFSVEDQEYYRALNYLTAVIKHKNHHYVFQFVGSPEGMTYLFDDFLRIIKSVK